MQNAMKKTTFGFTFVALSLFGAASQAQSQAPAGAGKAPTAMCVGCHGIEGYHASFPSVYHVPKISGQSQKYIENALKAYRKGERSHPAMRAVAGTLSDADISALASYYSRNGSAN